MRPIKFDVVLPMTDFAMTRAVAERSEALGFHSLSVNDHFFMRGITETPQTPHLECFTTLSAIAAVTKRVKLAQVVTSMSYRNPALLAKMTSTLDHISGGRLVVGLGAGWFREEYDAYNFPYPSNSERIDQMAEGIKVLKAMWTQDEPSYRGRYFSIDKAFNFPKPVQKPHPPIMIGGSGKKVLKMGAAEADIMNFNPPVLKGYVDIAQALKFDKPELKRRVQMLREFTTAAGRKPDAIEISGGGIVLMAREKSQVDSMLQMMAATLNVTDLDAARRSPLVLIGTPDEVKRELRSRVEDFGMTLFVLTFPMPDAIELFAKEVMPEFTS
jgi:probable F420-dependent oxidoreductase